MPEISRFYGIIIKMYFDDHNPPHFHVQYGEYLASLDIHTLGIINGELPPKALGLVTEWGTIYKDNLLADWKKAKNLQPLEKIPPLK